MRIVPNLWFDTEALEAAEFYCSVFPDARITRITRYGDGARRPAGEVLTVTFELAGTAVTAINGGPEFTFDEAFSLCAECDDQAELDRVWDALTDGGEEGVCGWCTDRYGLSWQVVPAGLLERLAAGNAAESGAVQAVIETMSRLDVAALEAAFAGARTGDGGGGVSG